MITISKTVTISFQPKYHAFDSSYDTFELCLAWRVRTSVARVNADVVLRHRFFRITHSKAAMVDKINLLLPRAFALGISVDDVQELISSVWAGIPLEKRVLS